MSTGLRNMITHKQTLPLLMRENYLPSEQENEEIYGCTKYWK